MDIQIKRNIFVGIFFWMVLEVIKQLVYDLKVDIWFFGIIVIELVKGELLYFELYFMKVLFFILKNNFFILEGNYSKFFKEFVEVCLNKEFSFRFIVKELLKYKFIICNVKKMFYLIEFIDRYKRWKVEQSYEDFSLEDFDVEIDGQVFGGSDFGDWIFIIWEKDFKNLENGIFQFLDLERNKMKDILKRFFFQCLFIIIFFLFVELKEKSQVCGGNLGLIEELWGVIYLVEEVCFGILDIMVVQFVQWLQRYFLSGGGVLVY